MITLREIVTKFTFQSDNSQLSKIESTLEGIKARIGFLAGVELARGLFELGERFASFAEELKVAAESAGVTVEKFQELTFSAKQSAVSSEEMEHAMLRLARALYNAKTGGAEAQKAFYLAGITQQQIQGWRTSSDALLGLADRFKQLKDPVQKQALAMELLGRGSLHLVGYLSQGSAAIRAQGAEAQRLGIIISGKNVEALVKLEHALQKVFAIFQAIGARIAAYFAPILEYVINDFTKLISVNRELVETNLENFLKSVAYGLGFVYGALTAILPLFLEFAKKHHFDGNILVGLGKLAGLASGLLLVSTALKGISLAISLITSDLVIIPAAIAAVAVAAQALWVMSHGGKADDIWLNKIGKFFGKEGNFSFLDKDYNALPGKTGEPFGPGGGISMGDTTINVNVPGTNASPHDIASTIMSAMQKQMDVVLRHTQAGTASAVVR